MAHHQFAETLKKLREAKGYSKYRLAKLTGLSEAYLGQLEKGRGIPSADAVLKIATALDASFSVLRSAADADQLGDALRPEAAASQISDQARGPKPWPLHDLRQPSTTKKGAVTDLDNVLDMSTFVQKAIPDDNQGIKMNPRAKEQTPESGIGRLSSTSDFGPVKRLPVFRVSCGEPVYLNETPEDFQTWPVLWVGDVDGILIVAGELMLGCGFQPGDQLFFQAINGRRPQHGDKVVAEVDGGAICKLYQRDGDGEYLVSAPGETTAFFCRVTEAVRLIGIVKKRLTDV